LKTETTLNFGFVLLAPDGNIGSIKCSFGNIKGIYPDAKIVCAVGAETPDVVIEEIQRVCPTYKGGKTITSLINIGNEKAESDWNVTLMAGALLRKGMVGRLFGHVENEKDIIFCISPQYDRMGRPTALNSDFPESTLNGFTINKKTFADLGGFTDNPLELSRFFWAYDAINSGHMFKGVLGVKIT
jgi:hypothetical protein